MKKVYRRSLKKIFVSLFAFFYTFLPYGFAIADVVNEFQGDNATPMEVVEEEIVEEQLPEEKIELEEPIINPEGEKLLKDTMSYPVWDLHGDTAITYENVELGKVYIAPQDSRVKLIFTKLPEVTSKLTIEKITLTQEEIDITGAISDVAYDITTDMENGTFEYDLELPSTEENVNIVYVEEREDIFTNLIPVENEIIQKKDTVKIKKVDHFTIYITTYGDPSFSIEKSTYALGETIYVKAGDLNTNRYYKIRLNPNGFGGDVDSECFKPNSSADVLTLNYTLPNNATLGRWDAKLREYSNNCFNSPDIRATDSFTVITTPLVTNPPLPTEACGLDIALVLDVSGSIDATELAQMKTAFIAFVEALSGTPTQFSVTQFSTQATVLQGFTSDYEAVKAAINSAGGGGWTNWEDGLNKAWSTYDPRTDKPNLIIFSSDGNPNRRGTGGTSATETQAVAAAVSVADSIKNAGTRILALGIGSDLNTTNMIAISGANVNTGILTSDVISTDFSKLAEDLGELASKTCGGTITIKKYIDDISTPGGAEWQFNVLGTTNQTLITGTDGTTNTGKIPAGTYSVEEINMLLGYSYGSAICKNKAEEEVGSIIANGRSYITVSDDDIISCNFINLRNNPALTIVKTASPATYDEVGDVIGYSFLVTNTGNVSLTGPVVVSDNKANDESCPAVNTVGNNDNNLDPGESITCTASYTITQADLNIGSVTNTAFATADGTQSNTDEETVTADKKPALTIVKTASPTTYDEVGDVIEYSFLVTNTGNVTMYGITVEDDKVTVTCPDTSSGLAPLDTITCTASYTIVLADLDNGSITNTAYATDGTTESDTDEVTVTSIAGKITIQKYIYSESEQAYEQEFEFEPSWTENFFLRDGESEESGWLTPGTYNIKEILPTGWILAGMECKEKEEEIHAVRNSVNARDEEGNITLGDNGNILCTFTNQVIEPLLEITKENDTGGAGMYPGDTVTYTLTITTPSDEEEGTYILNDVIVTDLLPEGFTYIPGSWTGTTTEPVYNNGLGEWHIGDMLEGETITLTYKALISPTQEPGIYPDIAWTKGTSLSDTEVLGNVSTGADTPYVGTEVLVIGEYDIEEGEVLGVSTTTTLPVTGANKYITIGALILSLLGLLLIIFKPSKKTKLLLTVGIVAMGILTFVKPNIAYAEGGLSTSLNVRIAQPETKLNKDTFNIGYVVLDTEGRNLEVKCIEKTYGVFDTLNTNSGSCKVNTSVITESGTYKFYVEVTAGGETEKSKTVTVEVDLSKPLPITDYSKTLGTCSYTLTFNSSTSKVQIFRSDNQKSFFANDTTLITKPHLTVTPNSIATYTDNNLTDCTKTYYYAVRSIDEFNNVSPLVTDEIVTTIPASTTPTTTTTVTPVAITDDMEEGEVVKEEKDSDMDEEAQVKGEEDTDEKESQTEKEEDTDDSFWSKYKYVILAIIVVALIGGTYTYVKREK